MFSKVSVRLPVLLVTAIVLFRCFGLPGDEIPVAAADGEVVVYSQPSGAWAGSGFTVEVRPLGGNWVQVPIYANWFREREVEDAFCYFDYSGTVEVRITVNYETLNSYYLLPDSTGFSASRVNSSTHSGNTVTYQISGGGPKQNVLIVNQNYYKKALYIFANPLETNAPSPSDPNVIYFGPGLHTVNTLSPQPGQTIYVAGGAYVRINRILITPGYDNITIRGRGILATSGGPFINSDTNQSDFPDWSDNFRMEGIIIAGQENDDSGWTTRLWHFRNAVIENVKVCRGRNYSTDAFNFIYFDNVQIKNCFAAISDDPVSPKAYGGSKHNQNLFVNDLVTFTNNNNGLFATYETYAGVAFHDFTFSNIDVLGVFPSSGCWDKTASVIYMGNGGGSPYYNITFQNVRVYKNIANKLLAVTFTNPFKGGTARTGYFSNLNFINIVANDSLTTNLVGKSTTVKIDGVHFTDLSLAGVLATNEAEANITKNQYVYNVTVTVSGPTPTPTRTPTPAPTATPTSTPTPDPAVTLTPTPGSNQMHVSNIAMSWRLLGGQYQPVARVTIVDAGGAPVASASVTAQFTGPTNWTGSQTTGTDGQTTFYAPKHKTGGTWNFCVTNVTKSGWTYDASANVETCDSITAP